MLLIKFQTNTQWIHDSTVFTLVTENIVTTRTLNRSVCAIRKGAGTAALKGGRGLGGGLTVECHELPAAQAEDPHGRGLVTLGRRAEKRRGGVGGSFGWSRGDFVEEGGGGGGWGGAGRLGQVEQGGGLLLLLHVAIQLHLAGFVLEVVGAD